MFLIADYIKLFYDRGSCHVTMAGYLVITSSKPSVYASAEAMAAVMGPSTPTLPTMMPPTSNTIMADMMAPMNLTSMIPSASHEMTTRVSPVKVVVTEECCYTDCRHGQQVSGKAWWRHSMETLSVLQGLCEGNPHRWIVLTNGT